MGDFSNLEKISYPKMIEAIKRSSLQRRALINLAFLFVIQQFLNFSLLRISSHVQWQIMTSHSKLRLVCQSVSLYAIAFSSIVSNYI